MIVPLEKEDVDLFTVTVLREFPYIEPRIREIRERYSRKDCFLFKLVEEGKTRAFLDLELEENGRGFLAALVVLKRERGKGHAKKLVDYALEFFKGKTKQVYLIVSSKNKQAISLYTGKGFVLKRELEKKYLEAPILEYVLSLG